MINSDRIKQVRELRGLTQKKLAKRIGIKQSAISQNEGGILSVSDEIMQRIILQTGFPLSFFKQPNSIDFPLGSLLFRKRSSMTLKERCEARQYARTIFEVLEKMMLKISPIANRLPRLDDDSVSCAIQTRTFLGLSPDLPIEHLINTLENNGVIILALPIEIKNLDAFSAWVGNDKRRPVIVLSRNLEHGDRLRFNVAHELGHLVMHQAIIGDISKIEKEANVFAGEFLTPKESMLKQLLSPVTLSSLTPLKSRWKVSVQLLIRRAYDINKINQRQYKYLMQQLGIKGLRKNEPIKIPAEKPRMMGQIAETLYNIPIDYRRLASQMNLPVQIIKDTLEVHAIRANPVIYSQKTNGKILNFNKDRN